MQNLIEHFLLLITIQHHCFEVQYLSQRCLTINSRVRRMWFWRTTRRNSKTNMHGHL